MRHSTALARVFPACVQEHDDKDKQHHNGAGVNNHLDDSDEFCAQQQVDCRQRTQHYDERKGAMYRHALRDDAYGRKHGQSSENVKKHNHVF